MNTPKAMDNTLVHLYEPIDECPHSPESDELWQESWAIFFWDADQEVYVFLRMSQEPNRKDGGKHTVWLNIWTPEGQFKKMDAELPVEEGTVTEDAISVGAGLCSYRFDGKHNWVVRDGDIELDLSMKDHFPGFIYFNETAYATQNMLKHHIEDIGQAEGILKVAGTSYSLSGPAFRDHSWGKRDWLAIRGHRVFYADFGDDLVFIGIVFVGDDGNSARNGLVIKEGVFEYTQNFHIAAYMDEDGICNMGGRVILDDDGNRQTINFEPATRAAIQLHHGLPCVDTMCKVTMGERIGVGFSETSMRPLGGVKRPYLLPASHGVIDNGMHVFPGKKNTVD